MMYKLAVKPIPFQEFFFVVRQHKLRVTLRYNAIATKWMIDVFDEQKARLICQGLALICGIPILWRSPTDYFFVLRNEQNPLDDPDCLHDLGQKCVLYIGFKGEDDDETI